MHTLMFCYLSVLLMNIPMENQTYLVAPDWFPLSSLELGIDEMAIMPEKTSSGNESEFRNWLILFIPKESISVIRQNHFWEDWRCINRNQSPMTHLLGINIIEDGKQSKFLKAGTIKRSLNETIRV